MTGSGTLDKSENGRALRYRAFISYSQTDKAIARRMQKWLEGYRAPKSLGSRRIGRIFRDDEDLSGAADLGEALKANIGDAEALIVLCSPRAARSEWVEREIQYFRATGRGGRIFAVILEGEPNSAEPARECFPPAFRDGSGVEPLAVNLVADGRERAFTRLAAGLLDAPFDDLWRRERRRQRARLAFAGGLFATGLGLLAAAIVAGLVAIANFNEAEKQAAEAKRQAGVAAVNLKEADRQGALAAQNLTEAERQSALAATRNSDIFAREAQAIEANYDAETATLMALYGDPAAQGSDAARKIDGANGYPWARASLSATSIESRLELSLRGHKERVGAASYSPDGKRIVTASGDKTARVWDAASGELLKTLAGHTERVSSAVYSAEGTQILTASADKTARIWDARTGKTVLTIEGGEEAVDSADFSPDGTRVITVSSGKAVARLWDAVTGKPIVTLRAPPAKQPENPAQPLPEGRVMILSSNAVEAAGFFPDNTRVFMASQDGTVSIWDAATGAMISSFNDEAAFIHTARLSRDGKLLAIASDTGAVRVWNLENGKLAISLDHDGAVSEAVFSADGSRIVAAAGDRVELWDVERGEPLIIIAGFEDSASSVAFSPDGSHIVTATGEEKTARIWRVRPDKPLTQIIDTGKIEFAVLSADGKRMVTGTNTEFYKTTFRVWDTATGRSIWTVGEYETRAAWADLSPDGARLVTSYDNNVRVWDIVTRRMLFSLPGHRGQDNYAAFSPDGARIVSTDGYDVRVWNAASGKMILALPRKKDSYVGVNSVAFSPDGGRIVAAYEDATRIWDAATGKLVTTFPEEDSASAAFSPDGKRIVTTSGDHRGRVWNAASGILELTLGAHQNYMRSAVFSADGKLILTDSGDRSAIIWDAFSGKYLMGLAEPDISVAFAGLSPDGARIIATSSNTARVWDVPEILRVDPKRQVEVACDKLWKTGAKLAFKQDDVRRYPVLQGVPVDPATGDLVSPCKGVLRDDAFAKATR